MKDSGEFKKEIEYDDNAQAVQQSELLPIYDAMSFSGDIQPLEDIEQPESIEISFASKKNESRTSEKKQALKKKNKPEKRVFKIRAVGVFFIVLMALVGGLTGVYFGAKEADKNASPVAAIYKTEDKSSVLHLADGSDYNIGEAREVSVSSDGMIVWFCRNTSSATGQYDIRMIDVSSKRALKKQGKFIEKGIDEGWRTTDDGSFACYSISGSGVKSCFMYSVDVEKSVEIAHSVDEIYPTTTGNIVYFTRKNGNIYSLHRAKYNEDSENVASNIKHIKYAADSSDYEILYTQSVGSGTDVNVYSVKGYESPTVVAENVSEVYLDDYAYGGNLYYFIKSKSNVNWQDFITDNYYESDLRLSEPVEADYMVEKGFIFKRRVLDTTRYNAALHQYEQKLLRDGIREELDKLDLGLTAKEEYSCFAYSGSTSRRIIAGVSLENILDFAVTGDPKLVYKKTVINVGNTITMDTLTEVAGNSGVQGAMDYVRSRVRDSYDVSDNCFYAHFDGNSVAEYELDGYDSKNTEFILSSDGSVYGVADRELYYSTVENVSMSKKKLIDSDISDCICKNNTVYFEKTNSSGEKSLFKFVKDKGKTEIRKNIYSFFIADEDFAIILTKQNDSDELVQVGVYNGSSFAAVDSDISLNNFIYNKGSFAYIKNPQNGKGEMYVYTKKNGAVKCGDGVIDILYIG